MYFYQVSFVFHLVSKLCIINSVSNLLPISTYICTKTSQYACYYKLYEFCAIGYTPFDANNKYLTVIDRTVR